MIVQNMNGNKTKIYFVYEFIAKTQLTFCTKKY